MSRLELPKEPKFYNYESPITRAVKEITGELMKQEEAECMTIITREVGYSVDKSELIKALNYDREQYDKGYRDGVMETFKAELEEIKKRIEQNLEQYRFTDLYSPHFDLMVKTSDVMNIMDNHIKELNNE